MAPDPIKTAEKLKTGKGGFFRIRNKRLILTYATWVPKEFIKGEIENLAKNKGIQIEEIYVCHESADQNNNYEHTHIIFEFNQALVIAGEGAQRTFDIEWFPDAWWDAYDIRNTYPSWSQEKIDKYIKNNGRPSFSNIHPHIKKCTTNHHWTNLLKYVTKEDEETRAEVFAKHPKLDIQSVASLIGACKSQKEVLETITNPCQVGGALQAYELLRNRLDGLERPDLIHKWQQTLLEMVENETIFNRRSIVFIYDKKGGKGKSDFASYVDIVHGDRFHTIDCTGAMKDFAEIMKTAKSEGWAGEILVIDFARDAERKCWYEPVECFKNNRVTGTKWHGGKMYINMKWRSRPNKVIIMSNWLPELSRASLDRWKIFEINDEMELVKLDAYKLAEIQEQEKTMKGTFDATRTTFPMPQRQGKMHEFQIDMMGTGFGNNLPGFDRGEGFNPYEEVNVRVHVTDCLPPWPGEPDSPNCDYGDPLPPPPGELPAPPVGWFQEP